MYPTTTDRDDVVSATTAPPSTYYRRMAADALRNLRAAAAKLEAALAGPGVGESRPLRTN
jgi:hypothetical protein